MICIKTRKSSEFSEKIPKSIDQSLMISAFLGKNGKIRCKVQNCVTIHPKITFQWLIAFWKGFGMQFLLKSICG